MGTRPMRHHRSFSLVELAIVIAIIAVLGAIAVPRMTRASQRAAANALQANLTNIRKAIDQFYAEHQRFPGYDAATDKPQGDAFINQLTQYTDFSGSTSSTPSSTHKFGPYLRAPFPANPINGLTTVHIRTLKSISVPQGTTGWHASIVDGSFGLNALKAEVVDQKLSLAAAADEIINLSK